MSPVGRTHKRLLIAALSLTLFGCATDTRTVKITDGIYTITDEGCCNPEKGLKGTCFKEGRSIAFFKREYDKSSLIVYCGEKRAHGSLH